MRHATNRLLVGLSLVLMALCSSAAAETVFLADLTEAQEVPPSGSTKTGSATLELSMDETELSYVISVTDFDLGGVLTPDDPSDDITGLHLHNAPVGVNGSVVFGIFSPSQDPDRVIKITSSAITFSGTWDAADPSNSPLADQLQNLKNGDLYVNVHTVAFPAGEIRGQVVPEPAAGMLMLVGLLLTCRRRRQTGRAPGSI